MKKLLTLLGLCLLNVYSFAQLQDINWIFGRPSSSSYSTNATLYFGNPSNPVVSLPTGQPAGLTTLNGQETWGVITHPNTGNLVFYTDGEYVYDHNNVQMDLDPATPGYESLGAEPSCSQPVAICPVPGSSAGNFFIFSNPTGGHSTYFNKGPITYRIYNILTDAFGPIQHLPGPYGLLDVTEGMKLVASDYDCNVMWLIVSLFPDPGYERKYVVYQINQNVITYHAAYDVGPVKMPVPGGASPIVFFSTTKANTIPGITNVAVALQYTSSIFTFMFDNLNGMIITNPVRTYLTGYLNIPSVVCTEFSPGGRFLYYTVYYTTSTTNELYQIDLLDTSAAPVLVHTFTARYAGGLKIGPDSLIYHIWDCGTFTNNICLGRILQPDSQYIPGTTVFTQFYQQNFHVYYNMMGVMMCEFLVLPCILTGDEQNDIKPAEISVYPDPATGHVNIIAPVGSRIDILNIQGSLMHQYIRSGPIVNEDLSGFPAGIYLIRISWDEGYALRKLVKL